MSPNLFHLNRRAFLAQHAGALGGLALADLFAADQTRVNADESSSPASPRPRATSVICLFQHGGPSQVDLFDPKPELTKRQGQPYPGKIEAHFDKQQGNL